MRTGWPSTHEANGDSEERRGEPCDGDDNDDDGDDDDGDDDEVQHGWSHGSQ